jgi:hypothetical protein
MKDGHENAIFVSDSQGLGLAAREKFLLDSRIHLQRPDTSYERLALGQHALRLAGTRSAAEEARRKLWALPSDPCATLQHRWATS